MSRSSIPALHSGTVVRAPDDELDLASARELAARLSAAHAPGALVVLDLDGVTFLDSSALAVVLAAECRLHGEGGVLVLVHVDERVLRVLRICGLAERLVMQLPGQGGSRATDPAGARARIAALS